MRILGLEPVETGITSYRITPRPGSQNSQEHIIYKLKRLMNKDPYDDYPKLRLRYMVDDYEKLMKMVPAKNGNGHKPKNFRYLKRIEKRVSREAS